MKVQTNQQDQGLLLTIAALRSQVSDLTLRCRQFESSVATLMKDKLPPEIANELFSKVVEHLQERDIERSAQYKGVLQTALIGLQTVAMKTTDTRAKGQLVEIIKNLTLTIECDSIKPPKKGAS
jgi:hypothetical protein